MYEEFYGFKEKPFQIVPNPDFLYLSPKHKNALSCLEYGLNDNVGFILLTGEIGSGKTTLIRYLLNQIDPDLVPAVIFNTNLTSDQLLDQILELYELDPQPGDKPGNLAVLNKFLVQQHQEGRRALLIIDEAQNLTNETLEEIRMLSNIQSDDRLLLQIILVGQPELKTRFKNPALAQFSQRIAVNYHLQALTQDETKIYIVFRLKKAGGRPDIFTPDAMDMIFRTSKGIPRTINLLCDSALVYAFADEATEIDTRILERVIEELGFMGLYDKREFETASEPTIGEKVKGNGFLKRLAKLEDMVNNIQMQVEQQDIESRKRINEYTRELVAKLKVHLRNERKRNRGMFEENARLKRQLSELESLRVKNNSG
jgi:general secretion pathway protein A